MTLEIGLTRTRAVSEGDPHTAIGWVVINWCQRSVPRPLTGSVRGLDIGRGHRSREAAASAAEPRRRVTRPAARGSR
jgi:hypothetical protein